MKTLYSSTFLSFILAFMAYLGLNGQAVQAVQAPALPSFSGFVKMMETPSGPPTSIEVFDDFNCPSCDAFILYSLPQIREKYVDTKELPLKIHLIPDRDSAEEMGAAMAAKCAADQGKFGKMLKAIHETEEPLQFRTYNIQAEVLDMELVPFQNCYRNQAKKEEVEKDIEYALERGVTQAPALIIGHYKLLGNQPQENVDYIVQKARKEWQATEMKRKKEAEKTKNQLELRENKRLKFLDLN